MANSLKFESQKLAINYFVVAAILFGAQLLMGLIAATQFLYPSFLFEIFDFSVARMVHINALVVWMLYAMIGAVYFLLPEETGVETVGVGLAKLGFYILTAAVTVVVLVYILVQVGPASESTIWLINEGREYIEAPRWADIGIVVVVLVFVFNLFATAMKGEQTGVITVLMADVLALAGLYLAGMFFTDNISMDQYWWWWVIHLWVEATWEVFVGCLAAYGLMRMIGARREVVESYIKRLKEMEDLALSYPGVEKTFAIQAGRELRVIVESEKITDQQAEALSFDIAERIQTEMTYPGQVKVTVIRETRAVSFAK